MTNCNLPSRVELSFKAAWPALHPSPLQMVTASRDAKGTQEKVLMESCNYGNCYRVLRARGKAQQTPDVFTGPDGEAEGNGENRLERRSKVGNFQRVLVAQEHTGTRRMMVQMLRDWGFEPVQASSGEDVLRVAALRRPPSLIILSRSLPTSDFFSLCRRLNPPSADSGPYILVLAMPGHKNEIVRALESGATEYLAKPFEAAELKARLMAAARILQRQEELITSRDRFRLLATTDTLTAVWNRRSITQLLHDELSRAEQSQRNTGVLLIDLDHFKKVNDTYGHLVGDFVLQEASRRMKKTIRSYDAIGRYGGEEFLVIAPGCTQEQLCHLAERVRKAVEKETIRVGTDEIRITLSIGAALAAFDAERESNILAIADAALYDAKRSGRNRLVYASKDSAQEEALRPSLVTAEPSTSHC